MAEAGSACTHTHTSPEYPPMPPSDVLLQCFKLRAGAEPAAAGALPGGHRGGHGLLVCLLWCALLLLAEEQGCWNRCALLWAGLLVRGALPHNLLCASCPVCASAASLGGASRSLLRSGVDPDVLVADLLVRAGSYTREAAAVGVVLVAGALLYLIRRQFPPQQAAGSSGSSASDSSGPAASGAASATGEQLGLDLSQGLSTGRELVAERAERLREWASTAAERLGPKEGLAED